MRARACAALLGALIVACTGTRPVDPVTARHYRARIDSALRAGDPEQAAETAHPLFLLLPARVQDLDRKGVAALEVELLDCAVRLRAAGVARALEQIRSCCLVCRLDTGKLVRTLSGHEGAINDIAFSPLGARLVSGSFDKTLRIWNVHSEEAILTLRGHELPVTTVTFSPDCTTIVSGSFDNTVRIWRAARPEGQPLQ